MERSTPHASDELTIGELAARSGVRASALRFYEAEGLITARRTDGNQRRYSRATLRRVAVIQAGSAAGIPLREIGAALAGLPLDAAPSKRDWARLSRAWRHDVDERIETLTALRDRLTSCIGCGCLSLRACTLFNPGDVEARRGSGAHLLHEGAGGPSGPTRAARRPATDRVPPRDRGAGALARV